MPRIIFLNRFFFPDHSATSQLLSDLAFTLAADGHDVHVIASRQRYDAPDARLAAEETINGVSVTRVRTTTFGRNAVPGRAMDYASCYAAMARAALRLTRPGDILIAKTDPPLLSILGQHVAQRRRARLINWLQDLYPDVAAATGVALMNGIVGNRLAALRNQSLQAASANVVLSTAMSQRVGALGIAADRIEIIPNWADDETITPRPAHDHPLRRAWRLEDKFVVGYSGNLGRIHDVDAMLTAADRLRERQDIVFVFIGGGSGFGDVQQHVEAGGLGATVRLFPYQPREALPLSLTLPDLHWLSLRPSLEGLIVPSKLYGIAAAGRPILALAAPQGEIGRLIAQHQCGITADPADAAGVTQAILKLAADAALREAMGRNARAMLDANFTRQMALSRWRNLIARIKTGGPCACQTGMPSGWRTRLNKVSHGCGDR